MTVRYRRLSDLVELAVMSQTSTMGITLDQIVERFEVSRRTAERMLAALRVTFVDLEANFRKTHLGWTNSARARPAGAGGRLPKSMPPRPPRLQSRSPRFAIL